MLTVGLIMSPTTTSHRHQCARVVDRDRVESNTVFMLYVSEQPAFLLSSALMPHFTLRDLKNYINRTKSWN